MQHLVILTAVLYATLLGFVFWRTPVRSDKSISFHVAQYPVTILAARWVMVVMHLLLFVWLWGWAVTALELRWDVVIAFTLACVLGALSGIVPYTGSAEQMRLHNAFAWMYAVLVLMLSASLFASSENFTAQVLLFTVTAIQGGIFFLFFQYPPSRKYFLYFQTLFMGVFAGALIIATYVR